MKVRHLSQVKVRRLSEMPGRGAALSYFHMLCQKHLFCQENILQSLFNVLQKLYQEKLWILIYYDSKNKRDA